MFVLRAQEVYESRGGRPGLPVPNSPYGLRERKATLTLNARPAVLNVRYIGPRFLSTSSRHQFSLNYDWICIQVFVLFLF